MKKSSSGPSVPATLSVLKQDSDYINKLVSFKFFRHKPFWLKEISYNTCRFFTESNLKIPKVKTLVANVAISINIMNMSLEE